MKPRWVSYSSRLAIAFLASLIGVGAAPGAAPAALSERGGSGVFEVQSAESKRPGRLELGIFGSAQRLDLKDASNSRFNALTGGVNAGMGLPGGFEASATVPAYGYYLTAGGAGLSLNDNIAVRLGDVAARLRWTQGFLVPGMRWGLEGEATFPTGNDRTEAYPGRSATQPFTLKENSYTGRAMMTWDGLRAGSGVPLRLHATGAYTWIRDESRFVLPRGPLPLELPAPARKGDNDVLSLGAAVELDLARLTLFSEAVTDQFVNERGLLGARENRIALTPGVRFWIPGGLSVAAGYSMDLSKDDARTAFDPGREFPDHEWRVALSLGTVYRAGRARAEDAAARAATTPAPVAPPAPPARAALAATPVKPPADEQAAVMDDAQAKREQAKREILERRPTQEAPPGPGKVEPVAAAEAPPGVAPAGPARAVRAPTRPELADTDGDGIVDARDDCVLVPEDWDGFQDLDGCPDLDNDGDGIPDTRDACPNDPETFNGYYDFDGCPDGPGLRWVGPVEGPSAGLRAERDTVRAATAPSLQRGAAPRDTTRDRETPVAVRPAEVARPPMVARPSAAPRDTMREPVAPAPVRPAEPMRPAPESLARTDSLALALEAERRRAAELSARLDRTEAERRELLARVMAPAETVVQAPGPPVVPLRAPVTPARGTPGIPTASADAEAIAALSARLERLERVSQAGVAGSPAPGAATVVNVPRPAAGGAMTVGAEGDLSRRLALLERELAELRAGATPGTPPKVPAPAANTVTTPAVAPAAPVPAERERRLEERFESIEARLDSLAAAGVPEASREALEALLPVGVTRTFRELRFETNSARLTDPGMAFLSRLAGLLGSAPELIVRITGHTDDSGEAAYNLHLSRERAATVARVLEAQGVPPERMMVDGRGEEEPVASNATAAGREANRRVTFTRIR